MSCLLCLRAACNLSPQCHSLKDHLSPAIPLISRLPPLHPILRPCGLSVCSPCRKPQLYSPPHPCSSLAPRQATQHGSWGHYSVAHGCQILREGTIIFLLGCLEGLLVSSPHPLNPLLWTHPIIKGVPFHQHGQSEHRDRKKCGQGGNIPPSSCQQRGSGEIRQSLPRWPGWNFLPTESGRVLPPTGATASPPLWGTWTVQG